MSTGGALVGVRVLEVGDLVGAPYCGKLLADLGADVIKVEQPGRGDEARTRGPFWQGPPHPERSGLYLYVNTNKSGITLDLHHPRGKAIFRELARNADVLIEDKLPKEKDELGWDYEALRADNPGLIMASITAFGTSGPYKDFKADHLNLYESAGHGLIYVGKEYVDRPPLQGPGYHADYESAIGACTAILAALHFRGVSGVGQQIDFSKQEWCLLLNAMYMGKYANGGLPIRRANSAMPFGGVLPCRDGHVMLLIVENHHWQRLLKAMGEPPVFQDERFATQVGRARHGEEINRHLAEWFGQYEKEEIYHRLQQQGIPIAPVATVDEVIASPQMAARGYFVEVEHPEVGTALYPSVPYQFSELPREADRPAPRLGQHNADVYGRLLGIGATELAELHAMGVI